MSKNAQKIGWIGAGRMGTPMVERLLKAGHDVSIWNRTRAKAEPLATKGGKIVDKLSDLAGCDVVFSIVSEGKDLDEPYNKYRDANAAMRSTVVNAYGPMKYALSLMGKCANELRMPLVTMTAGPAEKLRTAMKESRLI